MDVRKEGSGGRGSSRLLLGILSTVGILGTLFLLSHAEPGRRAAPDQGPLDEDLYPTRSKWAAEPAGSANVSLFVFRDADRSGAYNPGDPPLAGIAVRLWRPNGSVITRRSNGNGFSNFTNAVGDPRVDISGGGEYLFEVVAPEGWRITTGAAQQMVRFEVAEDTRPGIVAHRVPSPVGLAPDLSLSGRAVVRGAGGGFRPAQRARVILRSPDGRNMTAVADEHGRYGVSLDRGLWNLEVVEGNGRRSAGRTIRVDQAPVEVSTTALGEHEEDPFPGERQVVDFESITSSDLTKVPNGIGGLAWTNLIVTHKALYGGEGYVNSTISGDYVGYNTSGYPVLIEHPEGFDFFGGFFGVAWLSGQGERLQIRAWRGEEMAYSEEVGLSALGPLWFDAAFHRITRLEIKTVHYWQFVADDLAFGVPHQGRGASPTAARSRTPVQDPNG